MAIKVGSMTNQLYLEMCVCFFGVNTYTLYIYIHMLGILNDINTYTNANALSVVDIIQLCPVDRSSVVTSSNTDLEYPQHIHSTYPPNMRDTLDTLQHAIHNQFNPSSSRAHTHNAATNNGCHVLSKDLHGCKQLVVGRFEHCTTYHSHVGIFPVMPVCLIISLFAH